LDGTSVAASPVSHQSNLHTTWYFHQLEPDWKIEFIPGPTHGVRNILPYANESHVSHVEPSTSKPVEMGLVGLLAETYFRGHLSGDIGLYVLPVCIQVNIKIRKE
jgi:hypothetical protein